MRSSHPPLRIALISDYFHPIVGGIETHLMGLAEELMKAGHEPHIITSIPGPDSGYPFPVHRLAVPITKRFRYIYTPAPFFKINDLLRQYDFDVIHCHSSVLSPLSYGSIYLAKRHGCPAVVTWHSIIKYYSCLFALADRILGWSRWPVLFSAVSPSAAHFLKSAGRMDTVHVLPNAVDTDRWSGTVDRKNPNEINVVSVMRLSIRKRAHALIRLVPEILKQCPPDRRLRLTIAGDGLQKTRLEKLVRRLNLEDIVDLPGFLEQEAIAELLKRSDIFVLPTKLEAFGLAALEARSAGLPVVGMKRSGIQHLISHGKEGLLADNDKELKEHLLTLITDDNLRMNITRHNSTTNAKWTWKESIDCHLQLYTMARQERNLYDERNHRSMCEAKP